MEQQSNDNIHASAQSRAEGANLTDVLAAVEKAWPGAALNGDYFRYDIFPEGTEKERWSLFCDIQDALRETGYEIVDPQIEHDCISGQLQEVANA